MACRCFSISFVLLSCAAALLAQDQNAGQNDGLSLEQKRAAVRAGMIREFADSLDDTRLQQINESVAKMSPARIQQLYDIHQRRAADELQPQNAAGRNGAGFAPVITTLPSGAQLGASAVVSPDRRYVRMNLSPFFSNVGPVNTFTFAQPYGYPYNGYPNGYPYGNPYGYQPYNQPYAQPYYQQPGPYAQPAQPNRPAATQPTKPSRPTIAELQSQPRPPVKYPRKVGN